MKTDFENIVTEIVSGWPKRKRELYERGGLIGISSREQGDDAEDYIVNKVRQLNIKYHAIKSPGSRSPSDIFALGRRKDYWHLMMIQVKSSLEKNDIVTLNSSAQKEFDELGKFVVKFFDKNDRFSKEHGKKPIIISNGYAGVWRQETSSGTRHRLDDRAKGYNMWGRNIPDNLLKASKDIISITHKL